MWWVNEVQLSGFRCYDCSDWTKPRLQMSWKLWAEVLRAQTPSARTLTTDSVCIERLLTSTLPTPGMTEPWRYTVSWTATKNNTFLVVNGQRLRDLYAHSTSQIQCTETKLRNRARPIPPSTMYFLSIELIRKNREYSNLQSYSESYIRRINLASSSSTKFVT